MPDSQPTAIVGVTVIDGNGGPPLHDSCILVVGSRIEAITSQAPEDLTKTRVIDGRGRFAMPGIVDTNVHLSLCIQDVGARYESLVRYFDRNAELVLEAAQLYLKHGVTTVRDSYGFLTPLTQVRDSIIRGEAPGPRILTAGNIVGWGGPFSTTFGRPHGAGLSRRPVAWTYDDLTLFQEQVNDQMTLGSGEELMDMDIDELRVAINRYMDRGPDFIKYGGTSHWWLPALIGFSSNAQRAMVEEGHRRGLVVETHATTPESLRTAIESGVDLIQHPEILDPREIPDDILLELRRRKTICSMRVSTLTGPDWQSHVEHQSRAKIELAARARPRLPTSAERTRERAELAIPREIERRNAEQIIGAGCLVTIGTDRGIGSAPEFRRVQRSYSERELGPATVQGIEGLVELGMAPSAAIVAATRNGAIACKALDEIGTLEAGKSADLILLDADPLEDIANVHKQSLVMRAGRVIDRGTLPERPVYYPN